MNIQQIRNNAIFYQNKYLETFYLITTYYGRSFILIGEKENFPHLMGIGKQMYQSNGYRKPRSLFRDILNNLPISTNIIPNNIVRGSKMYKKALNFNKSSNIFWRNKCPILINYDKTRNNRQLDNVDILFSDTDSGYLLGWVRNKDIPIGSSINLVKYCITTWIDDSSKSYQQKEKYIPNQDIELIREVIAFNFNSELVKNKSYHYSNLEKENILKIVERNQANLLMDSRNEHYYVEIAQNSNIHCKINNIQY